MQNIKNKYPVFLFNEISLRLAKEKCYFRQYKRKSPVVIVSSPAAWRIFQHFDGTKTLAEISAYLAPLFGIKTEMLLSDICEMINPLLENNILVLSGTQNKQISPALAIVADKIRNNLHIDLTEMCNENCIHCLADKDGNELPEETVIAAMESGAKAGLCSISLSGGEAMLHPGFWHIVEYACAIGYSVTLFSNALKIDEECAKRLSCLPIDDVRLSVYSTVESIHDGITGVKGSLHKTMQAAELLKKQGCRVYINCPVMKNNYDSAEKIMEYAKNNNFRFNLDASIQPARDGRKDNKDLQLSHNEKKHIIELMFPKGALGYNVEKDKMICSAGSGQNYYIDSKGRVSLCPGMKIHIGNINEKSLYEIIAEDTLTPECAAITYETLDKCSKCELRKACQRCHARALRDSGRLGGCSKEDLAFALVHKEIMEERNVWNENNYKEHKDEREKCS